MRIINPATEELIKEIKDDTRESLQEKFRLLHALQTIWRKVSLNDRIAVLKKFALKLEENREHLASVLTSEVGKPLKQARNEIYGAIARVNWLTGNALKYLTDEIMHSETGLQERISYEPLGVV